jgi:hypothetical protein
MAVNEFGVWKCSAVACEAGPRRPVVRTRDAAFRPRRASSPMIVPFPKDCLTITIHSPAPKLTDEAGTRHRFEQAA